MTTYLELQALPNTMLKQYQELRHAARKYRRSDTILFLQVKSMENPVNIHPYVMRPDGKILVNLGDERILGGLAAVIIPYPTSVVYRHQAGGTSISYPEVEGLVCPVKLPPELDISIHASGADHRCLTSLRPEIMDWFDMVFEKNQCRFVIDRSRAKEGMEAWLPIIFWTDTLAWLAYQNCD